MQRTSCPNGHPFTSENAYTWKGRRQCRLCHRENSLKYARKRQALNAKPKRTEADRFWAMVEKGVGSKDCWIWLGAIGKPPDNYGRFRAKVSGEWKTVRTHRWAYQNLVGPIPDGHDLDHYECGNKSCVNPSHVVPRTPTEHAYQPDSGAGMRLAKTHCKRGHPFDKANTYIRPNGARMCKACSADQKREDYHKMSLEERSSRQRLYRAS